MKARCSTLVLKEREETAGVVVRLGKGERATVDIAKRIRARKEIWRSFCKLAIVGLMLGRGPIHRLALAVANGLSGPT